MAAMNNYAIYRQDDISRNLDIAGFRPLDVMLTGVTGAGKSSTLNSLFQMTVASVGTGVDPETMRISSHALSDFFRVWDTPGLGDGVQKDAEHKARISKLLQEDCIICNEVYGMIDLAVIVIEGCNRDMRTTYDLLEEVVIPNIQSDRILVAINQADMAMKGYHWDKLSNRPDLQLIEFLQEQALSIQRRIKDSTGINICTPVFYSAEYNYNIDKFLDFIIDHMPKERRKPNHG